MNYKAFISYSHAADDKLAPAVQSALRGFAKRWYQIRAFRVFRDKTSLSANPALWPSIEAALAESEFLLLLASEEAARSPWVAREAGWWFANRSRDTMLILLTDGDLVWDGNRGDFDWAVTNCLPATCKGKFRDEPLYVDLRWAKTQDKLSLRHSQFRAAILDIAAPLHQRPKDELDGEDVRQHRRLLAAGWTAAVLLTILSVVAGLAAYAAGQQQRKAEQAAVAERGARLNEEVARKDAVAQRNVAREQRDRAETALRVAEERLYLSQMNLAYRAWEEDNIPLVSDLLTSLLPGPGAADLRSIEWYYLWRAIHSDLVTIFEKQEVTALAAAPDGHILALGTAKGAVRLYSSKGRLVRELPPLTGSSHFEQLVFSTPETLAGCARDGRVRFWNIRTGDHSREGDSPKGLWPTANALSPDGSMSARLTAKGEIFLRAVVGGADTLWFRSRLGQPLISLALSREAQRIAVGASAHDVLIGERTGPPELSRIGAVRGSPKVAISPDGVLVAGGATTADVKVWDVNSKKEVGSFSVPGLNGEIAVLRFSDDGRSLAAGTQDASSRSKPGSMVVWDITTGATRVYLGHSAPVRALSFFRDRPLLMSGSADNTAKLWNSTADQRWTVLTRPDRREVWTLAVSPDGTRLAVGSESDRTGVDIWDLTSAKFLRTLEGQSSGVGAVAFGPDGTLVSGGSDGTLRVWDKGLDRVQAVFTTDPRFPVRTVTINSAADQVAAGGSDPNDHPHYGGVIQFWDLRTGRCTGVIKGLKYSVQSLAFSPAGSRLAVGLGADGTIDRGALAVIRRPDEGLQIVPGFDAFVADVAFSPSGKMLAAAWGNINQPGNITIWDVDGMRQRPVLRGHQQQVLSLAFTPDSRVLLSASGAGLNHAEGEIKVWDLSSMQERATLVKLPNWAKAISMARNGRTLVAGTGNSVLLFPAAAEEDIVARTEELLRAFPDDPGRTLQFVRACFALHSTTGNWAAPRMARVRTLLKELKRKQMAAAEVEQWLTLLDSAPTPEPRQ